MTVLSLVIENHLDEQELLHGPALLPSHRQALRAIVRCRRQGSDLMVLACTDWKTNLKIPHSRGHRGCPHCGVAMTILAVRVKHLNPLLC